MPPLPSWETIAYGPSLSNTIGSTLSDTVEERFCISVADEARPFVYSVSELPETLPRFKFAHLRCFRKTATRHRSLLTCSR